MPQVGQLKRPTARYIKALHRRLRQLEIWIEEHITHVHVAIVFIPVPGKASRVALQANQALIKLHFKA